MLRNVRDIKQAVCTPSMPTSRHQIRGIIMYIKRFNFNKNSKFNPMRRSSSWVNDKFPTCSDFFRSMLAWAKNFSACLICCLITLECFLFRLPVGTFKRSPDTSVSTPRAVSSLSKLSSVSISVCPSGTESITFEERKVQIKQFIVKNNKNHLVHDMWRALVNQK